MRRNAPAVFVVDDEKVIAKTLAMILNQAGYSAVAFGDARQALMAAASGTSPDLLISDVVMPGISGIELAIEFRRKYPQCRILLFSGQAATANLLESARKQGHDFDVLSKPVHPADLLAKLRIDPQSNEEEEAPNPNTSGPEITC
jgi:CheY-like chemotaxis protein